MQGMTALHSAVNVAPEFVELLLSYHADINIQDIAVSRCLQAFHHVQDLNVAAELCFDVEMLCGKCGITAWPHVYSKLPLMPASSFTECTSVVGSWVSMQQRIHSLTADVV